MPIAGNDDSVMKSNILVLQTIERELRKFNCVNKIDSFFISQVRIRALTDMEHKRYLREKSKYDQSHERRQRKMGKSTLLDIDAAAAERGLSDEEDVSDDDSVVTHDTAKWSFCT